VVIDVRTGKALALHLDTLELERLAEAPEGTYERLVGIVDPEEGLVVTVRESETEPPQVSVGTIAARRPLAVVANPFPQLDRVEPRTVRFEREDGVELTGMLYLPRDRDPTRPLPTLVWIYPAEFSDEELAEQVDARRYRFHQIKEASPIAVVLEGYALLLNPTVPIIGEGEETNDAYVPQLVASMEAAIDYLVDGPEEAPRRGSAISTRASTSRATAT
jgi:dipeptidyl aminopeptidase/acylaminoacyl peptidase